MEAIQKATGRTTRLESVSINPENPQVLAKQLLCAAYERPISPSEVERFGKSALDAAENALEPVKN